MSNDQPSPREEKGQKNDRRLDAVLDMFRTRELMQLAELNKLWVNVEFACLLAPSSSPRTRRKINHHKQESTK